MAVDPCNDWRVIYLHAAAAGIIGAGTNNARLAGLLRSLSAYYAKEPQLLFLVRVAQGLVHMGKGLLTLSPHHAHGQLLSGGLTGNMMYMRNHVKLLHGGIPLTALGRHAMPRQAVTPTPAPPDLLQGRRWAASWRCSPRRWT